MIIPYTPLSEISIAEIDRVISELESALEGRLDASNITTYNGITVPVGTNSITDVDGYIRSMKFIAAEEDGEQLFSALGRLDYKLSKPYQLVSTETIVNWELTKDSRRSEGSSREVSEYVETYGEGGSVFKPKKIRVLGKGKKNYNGFAGLLAAMAAPFGGGGAAAMGISASKARRNSVKMTFSNWSSVETGTVDKARDLKTLTFSEFFEKVWEQIPLPGVTVMAEIFNVDLDDIIFCEELEYTARHVPSVDSYIELSRQGMSVDAESISNDYRFMVVYASSGPGEELAISMQVKTHYLMGAIL